MKKNNKKIVFVFFISMAFGLLYFFKKSNDKNITSKHLPSKGHSNVDKKKKEFKNHHSHGHHDHHNHHDMKKKSHGESKLVKDEADPLTKKYKNQINFYQKRYLKFLSSDIEHEIEVKKELTTKLILLVRTRDKNALAQSFEAIVDKKTGKLIVNQGFTINENAKLPRFSPTGMKVNP
tara:strand:+ start:3848 stop:4381 length:534 start_codon:yes stop_codon:yes gene_type:complete